MRTALFTICAAAVACQTKAPPVGGPSAGPATSVAAPAPEIEPATPDAEHDKLVAKNPPGLSFRIRLVEGTRFRQGERIRVELSFASSIPKTYKLDGGLYDRIGRMHVDEFKLSPALTRDPLGEYFANGIGGMGGIRTMPVLTDEPYKMVFDLNEWHRFDKPGRYQLYVTSGRLSWEDPDPSGKPKRTEGRKVTSQNVVAFSVTRSPPGWRVKTLRAAKLVLDSKGSKDEAKREAARTLRFLGTESAAREMIRRLSSDEYSYELSFGLYGSPKRALIIREMEANLPRPDYPVTSTFLRTLSALKIWTALPIALPKAGVYAREAVDEKAWKLRREKQKQIDEALAQRLADGLSGKQPDARAVSTASLLSLGRSRAKDTPIPKWLVAAHGELPKVLARLPHRELSHLLNYGFRPIAHLPLAPALKDLLSKKQLDANLRQVALRRLYELDPVEGRRRILQVIRSGQPDLGIAPMAALGILPDRELPKAAPELARRLEQCGPHCHPTQLWVLGSLLNRYGTRAVAKRVRVVYERKPEWGTREQAAFLAYFLGVEPTYGAEAVRAAVKQRGKLSSTNMLTKLIAVRTAPEVERLLIAELDNPRGNLAGEAARALGRYGSAKVEAALWRRMERWNRDWRGKEKQLRHPLIGTNPNSGQIQLERHLWRAIASGHAWIADHDKLTKLRALLVTEQERKQLDYKLSQWKHGSFSIRWHRQDDGKVRVSVAQYDLESLEALSAKLAQFPRSTRFEWRPYAEAKGDFEAAKRAAAKGGSKLTRP